MFLTQQIPSSAISSDAIVGVVGALAGVIIGWLLGIMQQEIGRFKITFFDTVIDIKRKNNKTKGIKKIYVMTDLHIYNGKGKSQGLFEGKLLLRFDSGSYSFNLFPSDESKEHGLYIVNLEPHAAFAHHYHITIEVEDYDSLSNEIYEGFSNALILRKAYFEFRKNSTGKVKRKRIRKPLIINNDKNFLY